MNYNENIGSIITEHRKKLNMSQNTLAKKLFVTRQAVSNWEHNKSYPDISVIFKLCKILKIDIRLLIDLDKNIKIEDVIEVEKKKTNRHNLIFIIVLIIVFLSIIATIYIVHNKNEFALYNVYLDSEEFSLSNSIIVKSKVKNYFQFGTLTSQLDNTDENTRYNLTIYKKNGNQERLIFERMYNPDLAISEDYGYGEYFDDFDVDLDNIYLKISFINDEQEYVYDYKLRIEENFKSDSLLYLKNKEIGSENSTNDQKNEITGTTLINNGYIYKEYMDNFTKTMDNIIITYNPKSNLFSYKEYNDEEIILVNYYLESGRLDGTIYDNLGNVISKKIPNEILNNIKNILDNEYQNLGGN